MSRLVVVSNRVGSVDSKGGQAGGLAVAVGDALKERGGLWFGWSGGIGEDERVKVAPAEGAANVTIATFPLSARDYETYYLGYANQVLWPVLHYRLDLSKFDNDFIEGYRRVNRRFANLLAPLLRPGDRIWIHDYHLIPLAAELRARGCAHPIGFFLHIPFPPRDILVATPQHEWLVRSLFACDLVGFQTRSDLENFQHYVEHEAGGEVLSKGRVKAFGRTIVAGAFPISIDVEGFAKMACTVEAQRRIELLRRHGLGCAHVIGVDRLDYTKGLPERFRAFSRFLECYPASRKQVTLMQIAPPTREEVEAYAEIRHELEALSGEINGRFGDFHWMPVRYIHRSVSRATLAALFRGSEVGLVTPLRDGMNLVAKEYVAAQDPSNPGVLVLSSFAGAAEELQEALIVNPYDLDAVAQALQRALTMPQGERIERHRALMATLRAHDIGAWRNSFLSAMYRAQLGAAA